MASSTNSTSSVIPKWQIVVGLGAAGAIGLSYWYMKTGRTPFDNIFRGTSVDKTNADALESGDTSGQKTPLERAIKFKDEGNVAFKSGKYDEAIQCYNSAIEICPVEKANELATFYQNRAAAYEHLRKWSSVIADCTKAIELNHKYEKALFRRARARETIKDWENCLDDITCVCLLQNFQDGNVLSMADRVLKELGDLHSKEAIKTRKVIMPSKTFIKSYFMSFSEDPVINSITIPEEKFGQGELKGFAKAKLAYLTEKYEEIIPACTEEINSSESDSSNIVEALLLRGSFYSICGQFDEAIEDFTTVIENQDYSKNIRVNALIKRASIYTQTNKVEECLKDYETAVKICPDISDLYLHRGQLRLLMTNTQEAVQDFDKAVTLNPNFPIASIQKLFCDYRYALQQRNKDLLKENVEKFRKAMDRFPDCEEVYILFGQILTEQEEYEEANELYEMAIKLKPDNASIRVNRGLLLLQWKKDVELAVQLIREALDVDRKCEFAYETLGTIEVQRGNLLLAVELFNKAIELARSQLEMMHLFSLRDAATSQLKATNSLGISIPVNSGIEF